MPQKHQMSPHQYQVYQKMHGYDNPLDEEESKTGQEKANAQRLRRKGQTKLKRKLQDLPHLEDVEVWDEDIEEEQLEIKADREWRSARTHKRRLKGLSNDLGD